VRPVLRVARAVLALGGAAALLVPAFSAHAETIGVAATAENVFKPASVNVVTGDTVLWTNTGGIGHTVTSTSANWSKSDAIPAVGTSTSFKFEKAGRYTYHCANPAHPAMTGVVNVRDPKAPPRPTTPPPPPRPTPTGGASPPTATGSGTPPSSSPSETPSAGPSATPAVSGSPGVTPSPGVGPAESPSATVFLGEGGLRPLPPTGRNKGLPVLLALLLVGGVGSAELRALLANAPD
jgi:plastocyanin